jgi:hypothetical protein
MPNGDGLEEPPELVPTFMPTVRCMLSSFMCSKKQTQMKKRRRGGLRALLARMGFKSKFLAQPETPPQPKPAPPLPSRPASRAKDLMNRERPTKTLSRKCNRPTGP